MLYSFTDNFNDGVLGNAPWSFLGDVTEEDGVLKLSQSVTDAYNHASIDFDGGLASADISFDGLYHSAGSYFLAGATFIFAGEGGTEPRAQFAMQRSNWAAHNDNDPANFDKPTLTYNGDLGETRSRVFADDLSTTALLDEWTNLRASFDNVAGTFEIDVLGDGVIDLAFQDDAYIGATLERVTFNPYGWYTGHYLHIDNLTVEGEVAAVTEPPENLPPELVSLVPVETEFRFEREDLNAVYYDMTFLEPLTVNGSVSLQDLFQITDPDGLGDIDRIVFSGWNVSPFFPREDGLEKTFDFAINGAVMSENIAALTFSSANSANISEALRSAVILPTIALDDVALTIQLEDKDGHWTNYRVNFDAVANGPTDPTGSGDLNFQTPFTTPHTIDLDSYSGHGGIDFPVPTGTQVVAAEAGIVVRAGTHKTGADSNGPSDFGNLVIIDHGDGIHSIYAHLSEVSVSVGDTVNLGGTLGASGETGYATGPHLHFSVVELPDGVSVNPTGETLGFAEGAYSLTDSPENIALTLPNLVDDVPSDASTNATLRYDPTLEAWSYSGALEYGLAVVNGVQQVETDWVKFSAEAGEQYYIHVSGETFEGIAPLEDTLFTIRSANEPDSKIGGTAPDPVTGLFAHDDVIGKDAALSWTPEESGDYFISIGAGGDAFYHGGYTLSITSENGPFTAEDYPTLNLNRSLVIVEGGFKVIDFDATDISDSEGNGLSYSIVGGPDRAAFDIDEVTGILRFINESGATRSADRNGDNVYEVSVSVTDRDGLSADEDLRVAVAAKRPVDIRFEGVVYQVSLADGASQITAVDAESRIAIQDPIVLGNLQLLFAGVNLAKSFVEKSSITDAILKTEEAIGSLVNLYTVEYVTSLATSVVGAALANIGLPGSTAAVSSALVKSWIQETPDFAIGLTNAVYLPTVLQNLAITAAGQGFEFLDGSNGEIYDAANIQDGVNAFLTSHSLLLSASEIISEDELLNGSFWGDLRGFLSNLASPLVDKLPGQLVNVVGRFDELLSVLERLENLGGLVFDALRGFGLYEEFNFFDDQALADAVALFTDAPVVVGSEVAENVDGTGGSEVIFAGDGSDWVTPGAGSDTINGGGRQ